jgi:hypothetical protein
MLTILLEVAATKADATLRKTRLEAERTEQQFEDTGRAADKLATKEQAARLSGLGSAAEGAGSKVRGLGNESGRTEGELDKLSGSGGGGGGGAKGASRALKDLSGGAGAGAAKVALLAGAVIPAASALAALGAASIGVASKLATLARAAVVVPAAIGTMVQSLAAVSIATGGVRKALEASGKVQASSAAIALSSANARLQASRQVGQATRSLALAYRSEGDAHRELTQARRDAVRSLTDMRLAVQRAKLGEQGAVLNLVAARQQLQRDLASPTSTSLTLAQDRLGVQSAKLGVTDSRVQGNRARVDARRALAKGVEGQPGVVAARRSLADANYNAAQAAQSLNDALRQQRLALAGNTGAVADYRLALAKLGPNARQFVTDAEGLRPALQSLRRSVGERFFAQVGGTIGAAKKLIPVSQRVLGRTAANVGAQVNGLAGDLTGGGRLHDVEGIGSMQARYAGQAAHGTRNLTLALIDVMRAAQPFTDWVSNSLLGLTQWAAQAASTGRASGSIARGLRETKDTLKLTGSILFHLYGTLKGIGQAAKPLGGDLLHSLDRLVGRTDAWANSTRGQAKLLAFFDKQRPMLHELAGLVGDIAKGFMSLASAKGGLEFVQALRKTGKELGPSVLRALEGMTAMATAVLPAATALGPFLDLFSIFAKAAASVITTTPLLGKLIVAAFATRQLTKFITKLKEVAAFSTLAGGGAGGLGRVKTAGLVAAVGAGTLIGGPTGGVVGAAASGAVLGSRFGLPGAVGGAALGGIAASFLTPKKDGLDNARAAGAQHAQAVGGHGDSAITQRAALIRRTLRGSTAFATGFRAQVKQAQNPGSQPFITKKVQARLRAELKALKPFEVDVAVRRGQRMGSDLAKSFQVNRSGRGLDFAVRQLQTDFRTQLAQEKTKEGREQLGNALAGIVGTLQQGKSKSRSAADRLTGTILGAFHGLGRDMAITSAGLVQKTSEQFGSIAEALQGPLAEARRRTGVGFQGMVDDASTALVGLGYSRTRARSMASSIASGSFNGPLPTATTDSSSSGGGWGSFLPGRATGGRIGLAAGGRIPGFGTQDKVPLGNAITAPGELLLDGNGERNADHMLGGRGALSAMVRGEHRPHGATMLAKGGQLLPGHPELRGGVSAAAESVMQAFPGLSVTATTNGTHAKNSLHYSGQAVDLAAPMNPAGISLMDRASAWAAKHIGASLAEGIHDPNLSISNGANVSPSYWGDKTWKEHLNHVHLGVLGGTAGRGGAASGRMGGASGAGDAGAGVVQHIGAIKGASAGGLSGLLGAASMQRQNVYAAGLQQKINEALSGGAAGSGGGGGGGRNSAGGVYDKAALESLWKKVGGNAASANTAAAIALAESSGNPNEENSIGATGLWQILRSAHPDWDRGGNLKDPTWNAKAAVSISSNGSNWNPWTTFCVPVNAEILTRAGWKRHEEVVGGDETLGFNPDTGENEWTPIKAVNVFPQRQTRTVGVPGRWQVRVTEGHTWSIDRNGHRKHPAKNMLVAAEDFQQLDRIRLSAPAEGGDLPISPNEAAVIAWIMGDGSTRTRMTNGGRESYAWGTHDDDNVGRTMIVQSKPAGVARINELLADVPHTVNTRPLVDGQRAPVQMFTIDPGWLREVLSRAEMCGRGPRGVVLGLSREARAAFLQAAIDAEGWSDGPNHQRIAQNPGPFLDAIEIAVYMEGYRPARRQNGGGTDNVSLGLCNPHSLGKRVTITEGRTEDVWCPTTGLGSWTVRIDGQVLLTGNTGADTPGHEKTYLKFMAQGGETPGPVFGGWYGHGGRFIADRPTMIGVGEKGAEEVTVRPAGSARRGRSDGTVVKRLVIENHRDGDIREQVRRELTQAMRDIATEGERVLG